MGLPDGQIRRPIGNSAVQPRFEKYSAFAVGQIISTNLPVSSPEGRLAIVTDAGRDAVDAAASSAQSWSQGGPSGS
jgi:hypothetical protein